MSKKEDIKFNFFEEISKAKSYALLFPKREIGLAIIYLYEEMVTKNIVNKQFTEKDIRNAFIKIFEHQIRHQTEDYSEYIYELQEYFLDYDQETQKYVFKDYAYKFCNHAKTTLEGAFNPTEIRVLCTDITSLLKEIEENNIEKLKDWIEIHFKGFEPKLREQIDFLEKQITNSIERLKQDTKFSEQKFIDVLREVEGGLDEAKEQNRELRSAYEQTKIIRTLLEERNINDQHVGDLISDVNSFISYTNGRLNTIDKKLERIQPRIRQLFSSLNRPRFNSNIQSFIRYILDNSIIQIIDGKKEIILPNYVQVPKIHINTPNFTILRKDIELFPPKPRKIQTYKLNKDVIKRNQKNVEKRIFQQERIIVWEKLIFNRIELGQKVNLSEVFFEILHDENSIEVAITAIYNVIKKVRNEERFGISMEEELAFNNNFKDISLWKIEARKLQ